MISSVDRRVREVFVELADTLVADYDVIAFLETLAHRVVELLDVTACGLLLVDHHEGLNMVAASSEQSRLVELFELQNAEGPCLDCYRTGQPVQCPDLAVDARWPRFTPTARRSGYVAVDALPMRLREATVGAMNVFSATPGALETEAVELAQALADVATIGILHERATRRHEMVTEQLETALNTRILIEQAKGVVAERQRASVEEAFTALRDHARSHNAKLRDVAAAVISGGLDIRVPRPPARR
jgi:transcriptional regulator with GAF, ATPase, and Fis domain